ncbi:MAG: alpha/beta hydrolase [Pseudomonadota bacterium]
MDKKTIFTLFILGVCLLCIGCLESELATTSFEWSSCGEDGGECAKFMVPLDYENNDGTEIELALIRFSATGEKQGSIFMNPGGPGGSATEYVEFFAFTDFGIILREHFDLIGFDPRGVGQSVNITCVDDPVPYFAWPIPENDSEFNEVTELIQEYTSKCEEENGNLLEHVGTVEVVRDLETLREELGEGKLNYIGLSYGTKIGALYAETYPENIRAMVLDGALSPSLTPLEISLGQAKSFEKSLQEFLTSYAETATNVFNEGDPQPALNNLLDDIELNPLPTDQDRTLSRSDAEIAILMTLYSEAYWPYLEEALDQALLGDGSLLLEWTDYYFERQEDGTYGNFMDVFNAINCLDSSSLSADEVRLEAEKSAELYPFFGPLMIYGMLFCTYWPVEPSMEPKIIDVQKAPQIMIVGTTGDPATPYEWAQTLTGEIDGSFLLTFNGEQHVALGSSTCVNEMYEQYLLDPDIQYSDTECSKDDTSEIFKKMKKPFIR